MSKISSEIEVLLKKQSDLAYANFHSRLMPTIDKSLIIGVRTPKVRELAKQLKNHPNIKEFLRDLPHKYYEQNNLHAFIIEQIANYDNCVSEVNSFLPYVNNWATCDSMRPKCFAKNRKKLIKQIKLWLKSSHPYTVRFGIEMLMVHFLEGDFKPEYLKWVSEIKSDEYYVNMMCAWYFATALCKQWNDAIKYFEQGALPRSVFKKAVQKAIESFRITAEQKQYLRSL